MVTTHCYRVIYITVHNQDSVGLPHLVEQPPLPTHSAP